MCDCRLFFMSSRRRHTRCSRDWSSDVCSSDLVVLLALFAMLGPAIVHQDPYTSDFVAGIGPDKLPVPPGGAHPLGTDRRSEERRVGKSVDLGGRRIIKKKK